MILNKTTTANACRPCSSSIALILVLVKDREFWFPPAPATPTESEPVEQIATETQTKIKRNSARRPPAGQIFTARTRANQTSHSLAGSCHSNSSTRTWRLSLPIAPSCLRSRLKLWLAMSIVPFSPEQIRSKWIYSREHQSPILLSRPPVPERLPTPTGRVHLSPGLHRFISRPVEPNYPLLAKQMKVQGAVVLEALIGRDGNIQDLHILSGPPILSAAAREAVKQWRFKPYFESGQAVETEARITVNFTISTQ